MEGSQCRGSNGSLVPGHWSIVHRRCRSLAYWLYLALSSTSAIQSRLTCLGMAPATVAWVFPHPSAIEKMPHRHAHWPIWPGNSALDALSSQECQADNKSYLAKVFAETGRILLVTEPHTPSLTLCSQWILPSLLCSRLHPCWSPWSSQRTLACSTWRL